jgi:deoxyribodipyrimidine photo-lyase
MFAFPDTRSAGLARMQGFAPRMGKHYATGRNTDEGPGERNNVSMLSPYLRFRMITEEEVLATTLSRFTLSSAEKFIQEVFWRAYFKGFLEARPIIWRNYLDELARHDRSSKYHRAIAGETGIDGFDDWVKELVETGYLHNHARMWFASIWIFTLKLPWELGADFMYRHLIDGDPASNTLSWRWVGGLHTRGKTYMARPDNIAHYTADRFHPKGLAVVAAPLVESELPAAGSISPALSSLPDGRYGLLLHGEDLHPESLPCSLPPVAIALPAQPLAKAGGEEAPVSFAFRRGALDDAAQRVEDHFKIKVDRISDVHAWCKGHDLTMVATPYAPVGPEADALVSLENSLSQEGISLVRVRRRYDTFAWPHATKGFFALKEKIPSLLQKLNMQQLQAELF